ncbi:hypothetical protein [Streptomyces axinellae]|uniref:Uncharacterized protein n=1 Tax=Streptomyces axinellae TaxID=552788 RepID=A0ABP6CJW9_9ACTN
MSHTHTHAHPHSSAQFAADSSQLAASVSDADACAPCGTAGSRAVLTPPVESGIRAARSAGSPDRSGTASLAPCNAAPGTEIAEEVLVRSFAGEALALPQRLRSARAGGAGASTARREHVDGHPYIAGDRACRAGGCRSAAPFQ